MSSCSKVLLASLAVLSMTCAASYAARAAEAPPSYTADPSVYKVIFEDQNFRVIEAVRKKGVHDKLHSHPVPSVVYNLTDCDTQLYDANGKPVGEPRKAKAGVAGASPVTPGHSAENVAPTDCRQIFVERK